MLKRSWVLALAVLAGCGYNTIQTYDEQVNAAAAQIKVQLQRRADLIPNLVETVKGYNAYIRRFPQVLTAKILGKGPRRYFELETPGAAQAPKVDFSK